MTMCGFAFPKGKNIVPTALVNKRAEIEAATKRAFLFKGYPYLIRLFFAVKSVFIKVS
jgi:hypothetical protein